jgi:O-antigen ligase
VALLFLELGALGLMVYGFQRPAFRDQLSGGLQLALLGLLAIPLLQLIPLPEGLWANLAGREIYAQALAQTTADNTFSEWRAASLIPTATESACLALLPPLLVFLIAVGLPTRQLQGLVILFLGLAVFQAVLGLMQYGNGSDSGSASGTYVNRNHLAGLLEMALPVGLAMLAATIGPRGRSGYNRSNSLRRRFAKLASWRSHQAALYGAAVVAMLLGLIFTRSRTGVALAMLGTLLCTVAFARRLGGKNVYGTLGTCTAVGLSLATLIGLAPVLSRFTQDPLGDTRWSIFTGTLQGAGQFFPLGSGSGTFIEVFRRFHPSDILFDGVVNSAHNDYLEWLLEGGLPVAALLVILLMFYLRHWSWVWCRGIWSTFRFAQVGAGIALGLMLLHSLVDFNLHIPANAIFFAFLAAVFFHQHEEEKTLAIQRRHKVKPHSPESATPTVHSNTIPPENAVNPFND